MNRQRGMTLVELLVSLTIILVVLGSASVAYLKLLKSFKTQGKVAQSYMANLTGLEMLRYDIEMAGFGLPTADLVAGTIYSEAVAAGGTCPYNASSLNDAPGNKPRAFAALNDAGRNGSDILTIKSTIASINSASKKSSTISGATPTVRAWGGTALDPVLDFKTDDRFVMLDDTGRLLQPAAGTWTPYIFDGLTPSAGYYANAAIAAGLPPQNIYLIYGLDTSTGAYRMPFNRVDYYLDKDPTQFPSSCAASTYTLYRAVINQADGKTNPLPLIDCVRDFQVAFGLDTNADGSVDSWTKNLTGDADTIRTRVREVRIFVLTQEGTGDVGKNPSFRFSGILNLGDQDIANSLDSANYPANTFLTLSRTALPGSPQLSTFTPTGLDTQYRWKVLELAIKPLNLK